jgi:hypothetical protein
MVSKMWRPRLIGVNERGWPYNSYSRTRPDIFSEKAGFQSRNAGAGNASCNVGSITDVDVITSAVAGYRLSLGKWKPLFADSMFDYKYK